MRRLPLLVERTLSVSKAARVSMADEYKQGLANLGTVSCRKGCDNCCYHPVMMTLLEGITLYQWLEANDLWQGSLRDRVKAAAVKTQGLALEVWSMSLMPCPLLKDNECVAYEARPFSCRITYSVGDPQDCHSHKMQRGILSKKNLFEALERVDKPLLRKHNLTHFRVPLAVALLYGERVAKGDLELEDCGGALWQLPE